MRWILDADFNCSVDSGLVDITTDDPPDVSSISSTPSPRLSSHERIKSAVKILRDGRISIIELMLTILDTSELDFAYNRDWIYNRSKQEKESVNGQGKKGKLEKMFDRLFADSRGRARVLDWFRPHMIAYVSDTVSNEMNMVKEALCGTLDSVTPEFLSTWDLNSTMQNIVVPKAPVLYHILRCAAQFTNAREKNKIKDCSTELGYCRATWE
ncbi:hypothetical protein BDR07DRAFT_1604966 [Suillus spraguei]|nr:hypothetical protein BDR07DRAFT_1604966 [Suillus spraguei]